MAKFVTLSIDRLNQVIGALNSYCNTGEIDCADDLVAELLAERDQNPVELEPVAWLHTDRLGGKQAFTNEPPPGMKALCQPLVYATQEKEEQEPLFWYRPRSDGLYEGPLHKSQIERVRKESGGWVPLYTK